MASRIHGKSSELYTLRVWTEETSDGPTEWRGKVQRAVSGETLYFRDWAAMLAFVKNEPQTGMLSPGERHEQPMEEIDERHSQA